MTKSNQNLEKKLRVRPKKQTIEMEEEEMEEEEKKNQKNQNKISN